MTLDELIATLNKIKDEYGGELVVEYRDTDGNYPATDIYPVVHEDILIL